MLYDMKAGASSKGHFMKKQMVTIRSIISGDVLASAEKQVDVLLFEGTWYFDPADALNLDYFQESDTHTTCFWKGVASYYDILVDGQVNRDAAWHYPETKQAARAIEGHVAFWRGVNVVQEREQSVSA
jgi:uncharacterized protein (DUF427 family)